jgi:hypothetical protein
MSEDQKRERGVIESVFGGLEPDHGVVTCSLRISFDGGSSSQGFGNLALTEEQLRSFQHDLCATFGVATFDALKGKQCFALRCWGFHNDRIEGLESFATGLRFTISGWRKSIGQSMFDSPLEERRCGMLSDLRSCQRRCTQIERNLETIGNGYTDWSKP